MCDVEIRLKSGSPVMGVGIATTTCESICPSVGGTNTIICAKEAFLETNGVQQACLKGHEALRIHDCQTDDDYVVCVKD